MFVKNSHLRWDLNKKLRWDPNCKVHSICRSRGPWAVPFALVSTTSSCLDPDSYFSTVVCLVVCHLGLVTLTYFFSCLDLGFWIYLDLEIYSFASCLQQKNLFDLYTGSNACKNRQCKSARFITFLRWILCIHYLNYILNCLTNIHKLHGLLIYQWNEQTQHIHCKIPSRQVRWEWLVTLGYTQFQRNDQWQHQTGLRELVIKSMIFNEWYGS